jgi:Aldo/keto reductase family
VQSSVLNSAATSLGRPPLAVALAWLLQRASNILLIPGTSSAEHLRENIDAASLVLPENTMADLSAIWKTESKSLVPPHGSHSPKDCESVPNSGTTQLTRQNIQRIDMATKASTHNHAHRKAYIITARRPALGARLLLK